mgnify:CR=1 FL=1
MVILCSFEGALLDICLIKFFVFVSRISKNEFRNENSIIIVGRQTEIRNFQPDTYGTSDHSSQKSTDKTRTRNKWTNVIATG